MVRLRKAMDHDVGEASGGKVRSGRGRDDRHRLTPIQVVGFACWRLGLLIVATYSFFRLARWVLTYAELPTQLEVGAGLALSGAATVFVSLIAERMQDARAEKRLEP